MPFVYFNAYNPTGNPTYYQQTGSTCTWVDNTDTSEFSSYTGLNEFWPSPDVRQEELANQDLLICWGDNSIANTTSKGGTAKISYWMVSNSETDAVKLSWLNEAIRCAGGTPGQPTIANALTECAQPNVGIWTNYDTDIQVGVIE